MNKYYKMISITLLLTLLNGNIVGANVNHIVRNQNQIECSIECNKPILNNYCISMNEVYSNTFINDNKLQFDESIPKRKSEIKYLMIHHTASENTKLEDIHRWHSDKGWGGIGYNFYIDREGNVFKGRDLDLIGAHCIGRNHDTIGIAMEGNFEISSPSNEQMISLLRLTGTLLESYNIEDLKKHSDYYPTDCPGKYFPFEMYEIIFHDFCKF